MSKISYSLAEQVQAFNEQVIQFVQDLPDDAWNLRCRKEDWTVGVVARHIGAGHYGIGNMVKKIVAGEPLPEIGWDQIVQMANQHASDHADCNRTEVLAILRESGVELTDYLRSLNEAQLAQTGHLSAMGGNVSARQLVEMVILKSAGEHFQSMKNALEK